MGVECIEVNQHAPGKGFEVHTRAAASAEIRINPRGEGDDDVSSAGGGSAAVTVEDYDILVNAAGLWCKSFSEDIMGLVSKSRYLTGHSAEHQKL